MANRKILALRTHGQRRQQGAAMLKLVCILLLIVISALAWFAWQQLTPLLDRYQGTVAQVAVLEQQQAEQKNLIEQRHAWVRQQLDDVAVEFSQRDAQLKAMQDGGQRQWLLGEAEALASLAGERLLLTADIHASRRLLESADNTLARIADPATVPARRALAQDIEALRGAGQVDLVAVVLRLSALQELIADLAVPATALVLDEPEAPPEDASWWQRLLNSMPVRVTSLDAAPLPLDVQQAALVRLALDNSVQQAQLALLQSRPVVYRQALQQLISLTEAHLPPSDPKARQLISSAGELESAAVEQALPEIGSGLAAIRALRAGWAD